MVRSPMPMVTSIVLGSLILTSACSTQESSAPEASQSPTASSAVDGGAEGVDPELSALVGELASMDQAQLQAVVATNAAFLERQLMTMSGMEGELGGAAGADKAYAQLVKELERALPAGSSAASGRFGAMVRAADPGGVGAAFAAGGTLAMIAAPAAIGLGNQVKPGADPVVNRTDAGAASTTTTSTTTTAAVTTKMSVAGGGMVVDATSAMDSQVCPSPSGDATIEGTIDTRLGVAAGVTGTNMTIDYSIVAHVGDDAIITGRDTTYRIQLASFENKKGKYVDLTLKAAYSGTTQQDVTATIPRQAGPVDQKFINSAVSLVMSQVQMIEMTVLPALQEAIESGRCVEVSVAVTPQPQEGTRPSTPFTIVASPTSRVDGQRAGGTVVAAIEGANGTVDPANVKVPANATFAYVAPTQEDRTSTVLLEARSKRGVGRGEARFTTFQERDFQVSGSIPFDPTTLDFSGRACPISEPFTVKLTGAYLGTMTFTPDSATSGTWRLKGKVFNAPFKVKGSGDYTVTLADDGSGGTLDMEFVSTIVIPVVGDQTGGRPVSLKLSAGGC